MKLMTKGIVAVCSLVLVTSVFAKRTAKLSNAGAASSFPAAELEKTNPSLASGKARAAVLAVRDGKNSVDQRMMMVSYSPKSNELSFELGKGSSMAKEMRDGRVSILFNSDEDLSQVVFKGDARRSSKSGRETSDWTVTPDSVYMMSASKLSGGEMSGQVTLYRFSGKDWVKSESNPRWKTIA